MFFERQIKSRIAELATKYRVLTITGPRQSGKTTLCKKLFPKKKYASLENLDLRTFAAEDPRGFLEQYGENVIIDEIQRVPTLLSYIQEIVDNNQKAGNFILTGSAQLDMMESVTQSLAGRTAIIKLLPLSWNELYKKRKEPELDEILLKGFYPEVHEKELEPFDTYSFYIETYIERDIRTLSDIKDLSLFHRFIQLTAGRIGQVWNATSLGNDCGVSYKTVQSWSSLLETAYVIFQLPPYYNNLGKRLIKSPKYYFYDTGLLCTLLKIRNTEQLAVHPLRGSIFENFIIAELLKTSVNLNLGCDFYYFRENNKQEIDLLVEAGANKIIPIEIKSGLTVSNDYFKHLKFFKNLSGHNGLVSYAGKTQKRSEFPVYNYKALFNAFPELISELQ